MKIVLFLILSGNVCHAEATKCLTTREFVTGLEFLRADEDFRMKEVEAQALAFKIAEGCTGAAKRFIRVASLLVKSGANNKNASEVALKFIASSDSETDAFITSFRRSIAEDGLDLNFDLSLKIALSLSKEFKGNFSKMSKEFEKIVDYCANENELALPISQCGDFAARIIKKGESLDRGVAKIFIESFQYLRSEKGPSLVTKDALSVAELLISSGSGSLDNFKQAYHYGSSNSGLSLPRNEAINFAKKMAKIEEQKVNQEKAKSL